MGFMPDVKYYESVFYNIFPRLSYLSLQRQNCIQYTAADCSQPSVHSLEDDLGGGGGSGGASQLRGCVLSAVPGSVNKPSGREGVC